MRVVALFRVSTEKQAAEGASLDAQERLYREHAARSGWTTVAEFRGCESATQAASDRHVLQRVLACVREQSPDAIYVHEQSRLTRGDELEVAMLFRELKERRIKIVVNGVVRDLASIDERFMVGIQSLVDRAESERIKERMQRGRREKAKRGLKTGGPAPYGYENPLPGQPGRGTLRIVPHEAAVVRRIFDLAVRGKGDQAIALALNQTGTPSSRGGAWCKTAVRRVLQNPAYIGVSASGVWVAAKGSRNFRFDMRAPGAILIEDAHEAILDRATWDAVHNRPKLARAAVPRLLTEMLFVNGTPFGGDRSKGVAYYRGPRGATGLAWLDARATDDAVWDAFLSLATGPEFVAGLMAQAQNPRQQQMLDDEIEFAADQLAKLRRRRDRLVEMRADGEIDKPTYLAKSDEVNKAIQAAERSLAEYRAKAASLDTSHAPRIVRAVQVLLAGKTRLTTEQKRAVLRSIVRRVDVAAVRTATGLRRDERGRVRAGRAATWGVQSVTFRLALPPGAAAPRANVGQADGTVGADAAGARHPAAQVRDGQLGTTFFGCGQVAVTEGGDSAPNHTGQLGTTLFGCGQVAVTVTVVPLAH